MTDPVQAFLQANALAPSPFPSTSRYYGIPVSQATTADGRTIVYVQRRFLPQPERFTPLEIVTVVSGDRLDNLAALHLGDPEQSWRLCDANRATQPEALVVDPGATLAITLPEGMPGPNDAG